MVRALPLVKKCVRLYSNILKLTTIVPALIVPLNISVPWRLKYFRMLESVHTYNGQDQNHALDDIERRRSSLPCYTFSVQNWILLYLPEITRNFVEL